MSKGFPIPLSVDALMARAGEITSIDIVDLSVVDPLKRTNR